MTSRPDDGSIVVIGGGLIGSAVAYYLALKGVQNVTVFDRSLHPLQGSTRHEPGYVAQYNNANILVELAKESVAAYRQIPNGFDLCGSLDLAMSADHLNNLTQACQVANTMHAMGAQMLAPAAAAGFAPLFMPRQPVQGALRYPQDGVADALVVTEWYRAQAVQRGVIFTEATVECIESSDGRHTVTLNNAHQLLCSRLVLASGIWTELIASRGKISVPGLVLHSQPYIRSRRHEDRAPPLMHWIRMPEKDICLRDHGTVDGIGRLQHTSMTLSSNVLAEMTEAVQPATVEVVGNVMSAIKALQHPWIFEGGHKPFSSFHQPLTTACLSLDRFSSTMASLSARLSNLHMQMPVLVYSSTS